MCDIRTLKAADLHHKRKKRCGSALQKHWELRMCYIRTQKAAYQRYKPRSADSLAFITQIRSFLCFYTRQRWESRLYPQPKHVLNLVTLEGCKAKVDLCYVKADRLGFEPATCQSQLQRPTIVPPCNTLGIEPVTSLSQVWSPSHCITMPPFQIQYLTTCATYKSKAQKIS